VTPSAKRQAIAIMIERPHELSIQRACRAMRLSRAAYYRPPLDRPVQDQPVVALQAIVAGERAGASGSASIGCVIRASLGTTNASIACTARCGSTCRGAPGAASPRLSSGPWRPHRAQSDVGRGLTHGRHPPSGRLVALLDQLAAVHGYPESMRLDNGPELTSQAPAEWCDEHRVELRFIQPSKPQQAGRFEGDEERARKCRGRIPGSGFTCRAALWRE
jgi:putative transposase